MFNALCSWEHNLANHAKQMRERERERAKALPILNSEFCCRTDRQSCINQGADISQLNCFGISEKFGDIPD